MIATSVSIWAATKGVSVRAIVPLAADLMGLIAIAIVVEGCA